MSTTHSTEYAFDHLVIIGRDRLEMLSQSFSALGFELTPISHHNLGSSNRLIMLDSAYIELLGWEKGKPIQRAEIADQAIGFDALVFRTVNAQESYLQLKAAGFAVNPVQDLSREAQYQGETVLVRFKTVRFAEQPVEGIRIYFCEHLTPEYVWQAQWLEHKNQLSHLAKITVSTADIRSTVDTFQCLLNLDPKAIAQNLESAQIELSNMALDIQLDPLAHGAHIVKAELNQNLIDPVDCVIDNSFFNQL